MTLSSNENINADPSTEDRILALLKEVGSLAETVEAKNLALQVRLSVEKGYANDITRNIAINLCNKLANSDLFHRTATSNNIDKMLWSFVKLPVGMLSYDNAALLGRDGYIFLVGGSNDVIGQYSLDYKGVEENKQKWENLVNTRQLSADLRGVKYHQLIVPEKISTLSDLYPNPLMAPTRLLAEVDDLSKRIASHTSGFEVFWKTEDRKKVWRRTDSHLNPFGSYLLFKQIISDIGEGSIPDLDFSETRQSIGDLIYRVLANYVPEEFVVVPDRALPDFCHGATKINEILPSEGSHMGLSHVWRNKNAPINKKIVVFGNSFFSSVEYGQSTLSWWFSRWFAEFHFFWTNEIIWDQVDIIKPDIVLWQGIERFLPIVPGS